MLKTKLQVKNPGLASIVYKWFDKNPAMSADKSPRIITKNVVTGTGINDDVVSDDQQVMTKTYTNQLLEN